MDLNSIPDRIATLCRQESTSYKCESYLSPEFQKTRQEQSHDPDHAIFDSTFPCTSNSDSCDSSNGPGKINECWREKICEWAYQVIDHFDFNREVVAVSLSYLDRFLCTRQVNKKVFQLAAMTSLYMAIKLYEPSTLRMSSFIELSRGYFTVQHIIEMEETLLRDLQWYMHPPTALGFVKHILALFDLSRIECPSSTRHDIGELARFLCELSVCDYFFVTKKPSSYALAALQTAMDHIGTSRLSPKIKAQFLASIRDVAGLDLCSAEVMECRARLEEMYRQGAYGGQHEEIEVRGGSPSFVGDVPTDSVDARRASPSFVGDVPNEIGSK
jgi:hypothetical protein